MSLITLEEAKRHLHLATTDLYDADVQEKADAASALVVDYLKGQADPEWTAATVPRHVHGWTLVTLTHLWEHRGDDMTLDAAFWQSLERGLARARDPALR